MNEFGGRGLGLSFIHVYSPQAQIRACLIIHIMGRIVPPPTKFICLSLFFFKDFIFRGEEKGKEREKNINVWLPLMRPLLRT